MTGHVYACKTSPYYILQMAVTVTPKYTNSCLHHKQKKGAELYVDGEKVSPSTAAEYAVREESPYMADYIVGEQGKISQIRLDKVDLQ